MTLTELGDAVIAEAAGAVWYLTRRTYTRLSDVKRYAVASTPINGATVTFTAISAPVSFAYLIKDTTLIEMLTLGAPLGPADAPVVIEAAWSVTPRPIAWSDAEQASLAGAIATLSAVQAKLEPALA